MNVPQPHERPTPLAAAAWRQWPVVLAALCGIGITMSAFSYVRDAGRDRLKSRFEHETGNLALGMQQRIDSHLDVLYSLSDYFRAEGEVSREAFRTFVGSPLDRHPGIQALEWVPVVKGAERAQFEAAARAQGLSGFHLTERDASGRLVVAARRPIYYPVYYVEPLRGNEAALGYAPALPPRDFAIAEARDTGQAAATGRFQAVQTASAQYGVAIFVPVYRGPPPVTIEDRRRQLRGLAEGFFLVGDMLAQSVEEARRLGINVSVSDESAPVGERVLLAAHAERTSDEALIHEVPFNMAGRHWQLTFELADAGVLEVFRGPEWWVLFSGLTATTLLAGYLSATLNRRAQVEQMVVERTRALNREKDLAKRYLDVAGVMMVMTDADGRVTLINRQGSEILGYAQDELVGRDWIATCVPERFRSEAARRAQSALADTDGPVFYEGLVIDRSGEERLIAWHTTGLRDESGRAIAVLSSGADVTDYKRAIEEVAARNAELKQAKEIDRIKNTFSSAVSHDLRTPLTSIRGYAEFLEDGIGGELTAEQQGFVVQIMRGARRLEHLVDDLLDFARIDAGTFQLRREPADLTAIIHEAAESLKPTVDEAGLNMRLDALVEPLEGLFDQVRIERVLFNLLSNAIKFTPRGGTIRVRAWAQDERLWCEVEDTGIGIEGDQIPRLFQRFSQLKSGSEKGGTGLGLSICQTIIDAHGGELGVRSEPGQGSVFWFWVPSGGENQPTVC